MITRIFTDDVELKYTQQTSNVREKNEERMRNDERE